jgi:zinc transport system permease protein
VAVGTLIGVVVSVAGVTTSFYQDTPSGGTIVLFAIALFVVVATVSGLRERRRSRDPQPV